MTLFRKAQPDDITTILQIIRDAQKSLKEQGVDQWQNGYPDRSAIEEDIQNGHGYLLSKNDQIIAYAAISFDGEKTYETIYEGNWNRNDSYAVIHRLAVSDSYKGMGISAEFLNYLQDQARLQDSYYIRVDTHEDNLSMQRMLIKNQFQYCGVIYLADQSKRLAYDKVLIDSSLSNSRFPKSTNPFER